MTVPQQPVTWRKSRRSQDEGACVELGGRPGATVADVLTRDSKNPNGPALRGIGASLVAFAKNQPTA